MKFTKKELGYIYHLVMKDLDEISEKRTLPVGYIETAQSVELKISEKCNETSSLKIKS